MLRLRFSGRFDYPRQPALFCDQEKPSGKSRTQQHFRKEADINTIMQRYAKTGYLVDPSIARTRQPIFADVSTGMDYHALQLQLLDINTRFSAMPAELRERFDNSPEKCLNWLADPANAKEAGELGLLPPIVEPKPDLPPNTVITDPEPSVTDKAVASTDAVVKTEAKTAESGTK